MMGIVVGIASGVALVPALAQTNRVAAFDPLAAFVGTWTATKPNENAPFLVLKLSDSDGKLLGTISHFKIGVVGNGRIVGSPLNTAESPVSDLTVREGQVFFAWMGDPPLHGGQARFVVQGTEVGYLLIPASPEEMQEIISDNPGASGFAPIIWMRRKSEAGNEKRQESSAEKWEVTTVASLINAAEFQYRFANGIYADYPTLVRSGQVQKTRGQFTVVPKTVQSVSDPLPGYLIRLVVTPDGRSYQLSIQEKTFADCAFGLFSDETGVIFDGHIPKAGSVYGLDACGESQPFR
ncbi:MAG: hypothetical protein WA739_23865 [Candidatus Acidiferrales bacterium]